MNDTDRARRLFGEALDRLDAQDFAGAEAGFRGALALLPGNASILTNLAAVLLRQHKFDDAQEAAGRALAANPDNVEALLVLSNCRHRAGDHAGMIAACDRIIAIEPGNVEAHYNRGNALLALRRNADALAAYDRALQLKPDLANVWLYRGNALAELARLDEAMASYDKALALEPAFPGARVGRGHMLARRKRLDEAMAEYDAALALDDKTAEAWQGRGNVAAERGRHAEALANYDRALACRDAFAEAWQGCGRSLLELRRYDEAFAAYDRAFALRPDLGSVEGARLHCKQHICDWTDYEADWARLIASVRAGRAASDPFNLCTGPVSAADQVLGARLFTAAECPAPGAPLWRGERYGHPRIRLAYISADFRDHAVARLLAGLFERHDRNRFEVIAIALGPDDGSAMRARLKRAFDRFVDVGAMSDLDAARTIRELEADILVDLMGFTQAGRPGILAHRPAPLQVTYLSYPGLTGGGHIDYLLADRFVVPGAHLPLYPHAVARLPGSYLGYDTAQQIARTPTRAELGLPESALVFCAYNNSFKLAPDVFGVWMRLLAQVPGSVLWLSAANAAAVRNLRREAARSGIAPDRLRFAPFVADHAAHLARYRAADLYLDTLPFNAQTTACDALWAGLPVLTRPGEAFCGRAAAGALTAAGLPELIVETAADYEAMALKLAREPHALAALRARLAANRERAPLFDAAQFARHVDAAFVAMHERAQRGEAPAHFDVAAEFPRR